MKKQSVVSLLVVVALMLSGSAVAGLSNNINVPGLNFGMNSYEQWGGEMTFSAQLATLDQISNANVSVSLDSNNPNQGWVNISFSGTVGSPILQKNWESLSLSLNRRGHQYRNSVSIGAYQECSWVDDTMIPGNWMSSSDGSITLSGVTLLNGNGGYDEYDGGGKGAIGIESFEKNFNAWAQFRVQFDSPETAAFYSGMGSTQMLAVPEPATLVLLGIGAIASVVRRRPSSK